MRGRFAGAGREVVLKLSDILLAHRELESFQDLVRAVRQGARSERFFRMDIKPPFADTPGNWEDVLESAFNGVLDDRQ